MIEQGTHGLRVVVGNTAAYNLGVTPGLAFADARARAPHLLHEEIDRASDSYALGKLAAWMIRFAPLVAIDGEDGLMLEVTGCEHLYGGPREMLRAIKSILTREGFAHCLGLASTPVAAKALTRAAPGTILTPGREREGLALLPITALCLSEDAETLLRRFGLRRIGQLYGIDRKSLARRFQSRQYADAVLLKLDHALGLRHDPIRPLSSAPAKTARLNYPEPISTRDAIEQGLEHLTQKLCDDLGAYGQGARSFVLHAFRTNSTSARIKITTARPIRTPKHILRLFAERLDQIDAGFGIDLLLLEARRVGPMDISAVALSGDLATNDTDDVALAALADRITAKLGEGRVTVTMRRESHFPDRAEVRHVFSGTLPDAAANNPQVGPRPIRLLAHPERIKVLSEVPDGPPLQFVWRRIARKVAKADGPERIAPEWWTYTSPPRPAPSPKGAARDWLVPKLDPRADASLIGKVRGELMVTEIGAQVKNLPRARDYYRVEDETGQRFWLFRDGLYDDGRGSAPDWFMHGFFA